jgi:hypothetical protein
VERSARESDQFFFNERCFSVNEPTNLGAVFLRANGHGLDVWFVGLAEVAGLGARDRAFVAHPRNCNRGI